MLKQVIRFIIQLLLTLGVAFLIHLGFRQYFDTPLFQDRLIPSYIVNAVLAVTIYLAMMFLRKKHESQLGFVFMFGSLLKFAVFFIVFYPYYNQDDVLTKSEFLAFFTPYAVCLIIETISLSKWLNRLG